MTRSTCRYRRSRHLVLYWSKGQAVLLNADTLQAQAVLNSDLIAFLSKLEEWTPPNPGEIQGVDSKGLDKLSDLGLLERQHRGQRMQRPPFEWDALELAVQRRTALGGARPDAVEVPLPSRAARFQERRETELPPALPLEGGLEDVLQKRRTRREYSARPLRLIELSTLLHHAARVVQRVQNARWGELRLHPYPTAGGRSELETFLLSVDVEGLEEGAYFFDAMRHSLRRVRDRDRHFERILRSVQEDVGGALNRDPAIVLLVTAVFEQVMSKYRDMGLSLIYKDVGAYLQTLYLVAAALDLAPCAIGSGDEAANSRWLGLDPLRESQVGCFICGPRKGGS